MGLEKFKKIREIYETYQSWNIQLTSLHSTCSQLNTQTYPGQQVHAAQTSDIVGPRGP